MQIETIRKLTKKEKISFILTSRAEVDKYLLNEDIYKNTYEMLNNADIEEINTEFQFYYNQ